MSLQGVIHYGMPQNTVCKKGL